MQSRSSSTDPRTDFAGHFVTLVVVAFIWVNDIIRLPQFHAMPPKRQIFSLLWLFLAPIIVAYRLPRLTQAWRASRQQP